MAWIATGEGFADALSGGPAAAHSDGPLLLVEPDHVPESTARSLARLDPGAIRVLGGSGVVSDAVMEALAEVTDAPIRRISGADRYATLAATVGTAFRQPPSTVLLATGEGFPDALSAGALDGTREAPLLTAQADCIPRPALDQLDRIAPDHVVWSAARQRSARRG